MANMLNLRIRARSVEPYFHENDPLIALLIADAKSKRRIVGRVDYKAWNQQLSTDSLDEEMWLYAYEATLKNLTNATVGDAFIKKHKYFARLFEKKVEFYRSAGGVLSIRDILHRRRVDNSAARRIAADFNEDLTFDIDEVDETEDSDEMDY
jgi:hypothetical protein